MEQPTLGTILLGEGIDSETQEDVSFRIGSTFVGGSLSSLGIGRSTKLGLLPGTVTTLGVSIEIAEARGPRTGELGRIVNDELEGLL